jgi:cephalosporin hydroxylase
MDGPPIQATPIADELVWEFTEAVWRTIPWTSTTWLGERVESAPTDLVSYQEAICSVRPDWVIETSRGDRGRTLFLASICEMVGHGQVVSVGIGDDSDRPLHPRLTYVDGRASDPGTVGRVLDLVGADLRSVVILGSRADVPTTVAEFRAYAPLVPVGSFVVVADTIVNGHPVWTGFGPGPNEGVKRILATDGRFISDSAMEKYSFSFNPIGYLRRVK